MDVLALILSSAVVSAIFSSIATLYVTERNYRNEYYKKIIEKRFRAHEFLNEVISRLKVSVPDSDRKSYHAIFGRTRNEYQEFTIELATNGPDFWVTNRTRDAILDLNKEFFRCNLLLDERNGNLEEVGKMEYEEIGKLRDKLEDCLLSELPSLHKVRRFLKDKEVIKQYGVFELKKRPSDYKS